MTAAASRASTPHTSTSHASPSHGSFSRDPLRRALGLLDLRPLRVARAVALGSLAIGCAVALAAVSAWLIARASQQPPVLTLSVAVVAVRAFGIGRGVFRYLERLATHDVALRGLTTLRTTLYARLADGRVEAVATLRQGDLLARTGQDADDVADVVVRAIVPAGVAVVVSALAVGIVGALLPAAGLVLAGGLLVVGVGGPWLADRAARTVERDASAARTAVAAAATDVLEDAGPLTVNGQVGVRIAALRTADHDLRLATDSGARTSGTSVALTTAVTALTAVAGLVVGVPAVARGALSPEDLAVVVLTPLAAFEAVGLLPGAAVQLRRSRQAAVRVMALLDAAAPAPSAQPGAPATQPDAPATHPDAPAPSAPASSWVAPGALAVAARDLTCGWRPTRPAVVTGIDLDLRAGEALAVVGPSGVGKTTLLATLAGLVEPTGGTLRRHAPAAWTAEDAHLFDTSILENLRVARGDVTQDEALEALDAVGLGDWVRTLPEGLGTRVGPGGTEVSGGERRRLLVARALVSPAQVLLVDEPAEHLDADGARDLVTTLLGVRARGRAVVVATHQLAALAAADEVLVLGHLHGDEHGPARVVARGTHAELLERDAGYRWTLAHETGETGETAGAPVGAAAVSAAPRAAG